MHSLILPFLNFSILIFILVTKGKQPVRDFVKNRHHHLSSEINDVRQMLAKAQAQHQEFSNKLSAVDAEVKLLREQTKSDAAATKSRIIAEAQKLSARLIADSKDASAALIKEAKDQLRTELAGGVIARAEEIVKARLTQNDRARIKEEFSAEMGGAR